MHFYIVLVDDLGSVYGFPYEYESALTFTLKILFFSVGHSFFSALAVFGEWMSKCTRQAKFQLALIGEWILKCARQKLFKL